MPTNTLEELLRVETPDDILEFFLTEIANQSEKIPVTDWEEGGVALTILEVLSDSVADLSAAIKKVAEGGLLDKSTGGWLTLLAYSFFRLTRKPAQFAVAKARLTCSASAGPYTITPGLARITTANGLRYTSTNTSNETLASGGALELLFKAESPGVSYNISLATVVSLINALPGVTVSLVETSTGSGSAMSTAGSNEETDEALRQRCRGRWATLGVEKTYQAYEFLATSIKDIAETGEGQAKTDAQAALDFEPDVVTVNRCLVDDSNPDGPGTIRIYLASDAGAIANADIITAENTFLQARKGLCATLVVQSAVNVTAVIKATVKCASSKVTAAKKAIDDSLKAYQASLTISDGTSAKAVLRSQLVEFFMQPDGVIDCQLSSVLINDLQADLVPTKGRIPLLSWDLYGVTPTITFEAI